jgi:hypothetical protein
MTIHVERETDARPRRNGGAAERLASISTCTACGKTWPTAFGRGDGADRVEAGRGRAVVGISGVLNALFELMKGSERSNWKSPPEPSKWNLPAWIWWRLGEPVGGEPQPHVPSVSGDELMLLAEIGGAAGGEGWQWGAAGGEGWQW